MMQAVFISILAVALGLGYFAYVAPSQKPLDPLGFMMQHTGYNTTQTTNSKRFEEINMNTTRGVLEIQRKMDELTLQENKFLDVVHDQQQILNNASKDSNALLLKLQNQGYKNDIDLLRLKSLTAEMQDDQRLLTNQGHEMVSLNNQLANDRRWAAEQNDLAHGNSSQQKIQDLIENEHQKQETQEEAIQQHIADEQQKGSMSQGKDGQGGQGDSTATSDAQQKIQDLIADEHQKQEDQEAQIEQRIADEQQHAQDKQ